jgi:hypothetical protein
MTNSIVSFFAVYIVFNFLGPSEIQKQRKDLAYFQRWRAKFSAKVGWESNKLQKHFRRQQVTF